MFIILMFSYILAVATVVAGLLLPLQQNHIRELAYQIEVKKSLTIPYFEWVMAKTSNT